MSQAAYPQSVLSWAQEQNVFHELLPFTHREYSPVEAIQFLANKFESWPKTKQTWTGHQISINSDAIRTRDENFISIPMFLGSYRIDTNRYTRFVNPKYIHPVEHTPYSKLSRAEQMLFFARLGRYSLSDVGEMYNIKKQSVRKYLASRGHEWKPARRAGQVTFARTMETVHKWTDIPFSQLARWFNLSRTTLLGWRQEIEHPIPDRPEFDR